jgi:hypothetical protein
MEVAARLGTPIVRASARLGGLAALLLVVSVSSSQDTGSVESWHELRSDGISVAYRAGDERAAGLVLEVAASAAPRLARDFMLPAPPAVRIYVAASHAEFEELAWRGVPDWGVGCAFPSRSLVIVKSPRIVSYPLQLSDVVVHEMAHVAAGLVLGDVSVPRWFHEGIAMTAAGEWRLPRSARLAAAGAGNALFPLSELERRFPGEHAQAMLAYTESFYAVRFLMEESGIETPGGILAAVAEGGSFDRGLEAVYGATRRQFEEDVAESFGGRFGWGVFLTRWNVLFLAVTLLFLAAWIVRVRRARMIVRGWDEEESGATKVDSDRPDSTWQ